MEKGSALPESVRNCSLRAKVMVLIVLALLPVILLEFYTAGRTREMAEREAYEVAFRMNRVLASKQHALLESAQQLLMTLSRVDAIRDARPEQSRALLGELLKVNPFYANIVVLDRSGRVRCSALPPASPTVDAPFLHRAFHSGGFSVDIDPGHLLSRPALVVSYPVGPERLALVAIDFQTDHLFRGRYLLPADSLLMMLRHDDLYLLRYPDPGPSSSMGRKAGFQALIASLPPGPAAFVETARRDPDGVERIYYMERVSITGVEPLYVATGIARRSIYAPFRRQLWWQLAVMSASAALALLATWMLGSWWIVRPAQHLVNVARAVSRGDLHVRSSPRLVIGEFREIGAAFNQMADTLMQRIEELRSVRTTLEETQGELEERVEHRTAQLRQAQERLIDAIEAMDAGFAMLDPEGRLVVFNQKLLTMFNLPPEQIRPGTPGEKILRDFVSGGGVVLGFEDDMERWLTQRIATLRAADGRVLEQKFGDRWIAMSEFRMRDGGTVSICTDVTSRVETRRALEQTAMELRRSNEELERFASVASHDLQEPLRMVASYTQLLARRYRDQLDRNARDYIDYAIDGAQRMRQLIENLLEYSRVSTRGRPFSPVSSAEIVTRVLGDQQLAIHESGAQVTVGPLPEVIADPVQLYQVFANLVSNALRFRGENPPRILIEAERGEEETRFCVRDHGIGIPEKDIGRIFVMFARLHSRQEYPGTGIGLPICKRIVERHGGRIWVESREGEGSVFFFTLPDRLPHAETGPAVRTE